MAQRNLKAISGSLNKLDSLTMDEIIGRPAQPKRELRKPEFEEDLQRSHTPFIAMLFSMEKVIKNGFGK